MKFLEEYYTLVSMVAVDSGGAHTLQRGCSVPYDSVRGLCGTRESSHHKRKMFRPPCGGEQLDLLQHALLKARA
jgi:hypothetical protein